MIVTINKEIKFLDGITFPAGTKILADQVIQIGRGNSLFVISSFPDIYPDLIIHPQDLNKISIEAELLTEEETKIFKELREKLDSIKKSLKNRFPF